MLPQPLPRSLLSIALTGLATHFAAPSGTAQLRTIAQAAAGETVQPVTAQLVGTATTSDGRIWTLTHFNDGKNQGGKSQFIRIYSSSDAGATWKLATTTRTTGSIRGSLATGTDGRTLHVAWRAKNGNVGTGIYYADYDTVKGQWKLPDLELLKGGTTTNQQYLEPHIAVTEKGTLVVSFYQHRQGVLPAWSGGMMYRRGAAWTKAQRVNVDAYGVTMNAMTRGEDVHFSYRTNAGLYGIRYRRFDTAAGKWGAEGEIQVSQKNTVASKASSASNVAVLPNGDTYVLYSTGDAMAGKGALWVAYSKAGAFDFSIHRKVADDAPLRGGNFNYYHYTLSPTADGRVYVLYSLKSDGHAKLYMRWMTGSTLVPPIPITLATGKTNEFAWVAGHREALGGHGFMVTVRDTSVTGGRAAFYSRRRGSAVFHGEGCQGSLQLRPRLRTTDVPSLGATMTLALADAPKSLPGIVFFGVNDKTLGAIPLPLDLRIIGMNACFLSQDFLVTLSYATDAQGESSLRIPLINDPGLAGVPLYFQAFQIAPGANTRNALVSNGIAAIAR